MTRYLCRVHTILLLLLCGMAAHAQPWDALRILQPGDRIRLTDSNGQDFQGTFGKFSADASRRLEKVAIAAGAGLATGI